ncbi:hypothetical protein BJ875DRAFT_449388 [Amylocarpus encephaloides]|uniref:VWFA domain-containing protein n=1 Tax=Amylocarpus encephaloides TaxID=45428 RepID=A0A9P7YSP2_9HELO|nr:hypothetical protein BJ875DRAFT_449388 [Amylocarpus encephaloides]
MPHALYSRFITGTMAPDRLSVFGSLRKLSRKNRSSSMLSTSSSNSTETPPSSNPFNAPSELAGAASRNMGPRSPSPNSFSNPSPATRRPDRPGMNAFTTPSNEPPPAYTSLPTAATAPVIANQAPPAQAAVPTTTSADGEDPYTFLGTFDTTLLIDDSGSMAGRSWREVSQALSAIAPIVTQHDKDGIDIYFLNKKSNDLGVPSDGVAPSGYRNIKRANSVKEVFDEVRPYGGTPTGIRVHNILKPYLAKCERDLPQGKDVKPLNLIVLTDGVPSDDVESVLLSAAKKLDKLDAPPFQVGVQFFQVGNEAGAKEALEELDDDLCNMVEGGVRDIVDTVTWTRSVGSSEGGVGLTGAAVLKVVLGSVVKKLDRRRASGEVGRGARR